MTESTGSTRRAKNEDTKVMQCAEQLEATSEHEILPVELVNGGTRHD
jgi:hypothetical protein